MGMLTEDELWKRVKKLLHKTTYTIQRRELNYIEQVTANRVCLAKNGKSRPSSPTRAQIWSAYRYLWEHCQVTQKDYASNRLSGIIGKRVSRIVLAILSDAVPEQIEAFQQEKGIPQSGIRLKCSTPAPPLVQ